MEKVLTEQQIRLYVRKTLQEMYESEENLEEGNVFRDMLIFAGSLAFMAWLEATAPDFSKVTTKDGKDHYGWVVNKSEDSVEVIPAEWGPDSGSVRQMWEKPEVIATKDIQKVEVGSNKSPEAVWKRQGHYNSHGGGGHFHGGGHHGGGHH